MATEAKEVKMFVFSSFFFVSHGFIYIIYFGVSQYVQTDNIVKFETECTDSVATYTYYKTGIKNKRTQYQSQCQTKCLNTCHI